jgi:hypothetical protein
VLFRRPLRRAMCSIAVVDLQLECAERAIVNTQIAAS